MSEETTITGPVLNIEMGAPTVQERKEPSNVRVFVIARDDCGVESCAITSRVATEDLVFGEIDPASKSFVEKIRVPKGHLDPRNRGSMISFRMNARLPDGTYKWLGSFDLGHAEQQKTEYVRDSASGKKFRQILAGVPVGHFSRIKLKQVRTPNGELVEIVDITDPRYQAFNAIALASAWPSKPEAPSAPVLPQENTSDAGLDIDDLPAE